MKTTAIIEGLTILQKYRDKPDGYHCGAEHDQLFVYATDRPVEQPDLDRLIELGWVQERECYDEAYSAADYNQEESWYCYT